MNRLVLLVILLSPLATFAADTPARLHSICQKLSAGCQTCGKAPAERTAMASNAPTPDPDTANPTDQCGRPVRVSINNNQLRLQSAGADGTFDSPDDIVEQCPMP